GGGAEGKELAYCRAKGYKKEDLSIGEKATFVLGDEAQFNNAFVVQCLLFIYRVSFVLPIPSTSL
uniref:hypothetical protein n=1 Tax=Dendronalium phyllosphericum TaxID=2840445 RepID=UPI001BDC37E9